LIRSVDLSKAVKAGAAGALAMEALSYALRLAGIRSVDLARELGSVLVPMDHGVGWAGGLVAHVGVGIAWALFYAYFVWGRLKWPPRASGPCLQRRSGNPRNPVRLSAAEADAGA
jgi:hypothetical protein